jgi:hypothetical protein
MRRAIGIAAFLFFSLLWVPFASANLIGNGSFEDPVITGTFGYVPDDNLTGWSLSGAYPYLEIQRNGLYTGWSNPYGSQWAELDGDKNNSVIYQSVHVTAGTPYHLEFNFSPRPGSKDGLLYWSVSGSGVGLAGNITAPYGVYLSHPVWSLVSLDFTPTSDGSIEVLFAEKGYPEGLGMLLDNVALNAVPIPTAAWMLGTGLLGLVLVRRRR